MRLVKNKKKWDKNRIYNTVIASLSVLLVLNIMFFILCIMDNNYDYNVDETSVIYNLEYNDYGNFAYKTKQFEVENEELSSLMKEAIILANYCDAYLFYQAYMNANELDKANEYLEIMELYEQDIDLLSLEFKKMKATLGV